MSFGASLTLKRFFLSQSGDHIVWKACLRERSSTAGNLICMILQRTLSIYVRFHDDREHVISQGLHQALRSGVYRQIPYNDAGEQIRLA